MRHHPIAQISGGLRRRGRESSPATRITVGEHRKPGGKGAEPSTDGDQRETAPPPLCCSPDTAVASRGADRSCRRRHHCGDGPQRAAALRFRLGSHGNRRPRTAVPRQGRSRTTRDDQAAIRRRGHRNRSRGRRRFIVTSRTVELRGRWAATAPMRVNEPAATMSPCGSVTRSVTGPSNRLGPNAVHAPPIFFFFFFFFFFPQAVRFIVHDTVPPLERPATIRAPFGLSLIASMLVVGVS